VSTKARIATVCQGGRAGHSVEANREYVMGLLHQAAAHKPDLVCLPESFNTVGVELPGDGAEPLDGPTVSAFSQAAKANGCYVICPIRIIEEGRVYNSAVVLGRDGLVAGVYHKACPVTTSPDYTVFEGVTPGSSIPTFDLDFGRIGIQICFDIGFPRNWQALENAHAKLVFWPSAYDGGFPLRAYAYLHRYYVVSSTRAGRSRVVDPCGEVLAETADDEPVAVRDVNLDFMVCHWDFNMGVPDRIAQAYGDRVEVRHWDEGCAHFIIEPKDAGVTTAQLRDEIGVETAEEYYARHITGYAAIHAGSPPLPQKARHGARAQWGKE
jgi:beta-ureidopropionase